ncbi:2Fe-2S iron-sulfur cluster-binding protein [Bacillus sp. 1P02SD]|uniref:2Fe-2S iron-sulfur cluster-binding protein n=1 Tax=Bacillus sp. 1P02SD TaxID=3132264 RepID=UPI0039A1F552
MIKVIFNGPDDMVKEVNIQSGHTILRAAKQGRVALRHKCGGRASCTTCKVFIENQEGVSSVVDIERYKLGEDSISEGMRLSCQTKVYATTSVNIPEDPYKARIRKLLEQQRGHL